MKEPVRHCTAIAGGVFTCHRATRTLVNGEPRCWQHGAPRREPTAAFKAKVDAEIRRRVEAIPVTCDYQGNVSPRGRYLSIGSGYAAPLAGSVRTVDLLAALTVKEEADG